MALIDERNLDDKQNVYLAITRKKARQAQYGLIQFMAEHQPPTDGSPDTLLSIRKGINHLNNEINRSVDATDKLKG